MQFLEASVRETRRDTDGRRARDRFLYQTFASFCKISRPDLIRISYRIYGVGPLCGKKDGIVKSVHGRMEV